MAQFSAVTSDSKKPGQTTIGIQYYNLSRFFLNLTLVVKSQKLNSRGVAMGIRGMKMNWLAVVNKNSG